MPDEPAPATAAPAPTAADATRLGRQVGERYDWHHRVRASRLVAIGRVAGLSTAFSRRVGRPLSARPRPVRPLPTGTTRPAGPAVAGAGLTRRAAVAPPPGPRLAAWRATEQATDEASEVQGAAGRRTPGTGDPAAGDPAAGTGPDPRQARPPGTLPRAAASPSTLGAAAPGASLARLRAEVLPVQRLADTRAVGDVVTDREDRWQRQAAAAAPLAAGPPSPRLPRPSRRPVPTGAPADRSAPAGTAAAPRADAVAPGVAGTAAAPRADAVAPGGDAVAAADRADGPPSVPAGAPSAEPGGPSPAGPLDGGAAPAGGTASTGAGSPSTGQAPEAAPASPAPGPDPGGPWGGAPSGPGAGGPDVVGPSAEASAAVDPGVAAAGPATAPSAPSAVGTAAPLVRHQGPAAPGVPAGPPADEAATATPARVGGAPGFVGSNGHVLVAAAAAARLGREGPGWSPAPAPRRRSPAGAPVGNGRVHRQPTRAPASRSGPARPGTGPGPGRTGDLRDRNVAGTPSRLGDLPRRATAHPAPGRPAPSPPTAASPAPPPATVTSSAPPPAGATGVSSATGAPADAAAGATLRRRAGDLLRPSGSLPGAMAVTPWPFPVVGAGLPGPRRERPRLAGASTAGLSRALGEADPVHAATGRQLAGAVRPRPGVRSDRDVPGGPGAVDGQQVRRHPVPAADGGAAAGAAAVPAGAGPRSGAVPAGAPTSSGTASPGAPSPAGAVVPPTPAVPGPSASPPGGRTPTRRSMAARFADVLRRRAPDPVVALPPRLRSLASAIVGAEPVVFRAGPASAAALAAAGRPAATVGRVVHLARRPDDSPESAAMVAHELVHATGARRGAAPPGPAGGSTTAAGRTVAPPARFLQDEVHDHEEGLARQVGALVRRLVASDAAPAESGVRQWRRADPASGGASAALPGGWLPATRRGRGLAFGTQGLAVTGVATRIGGNRGAAVGSDGGAEGDGGGGGSASSPVPTGAGPLHPDRVANPTGDAGLASLLQQATAMGVFVPPSGAAGLGGRAPEGATPGASGERPGGPSARAAVRPPGPPAAALPVPVRPGSLRPGQPAGSRGVPMTEPTPPTVDASSAPTAAEVLEWIVEQVERRVVDELERRGARHVPEVF